MSCDGIAYCPDFTLIARFNQKFSDQADKRNDTSTICDGRRMDRFNQSLRLFLANSLFHTILAVNNCGLNFVIKHNCIQVGIFDDCGAFIHGVPLAS